MKIIFLDIDGPMIPGRIYYAGRPYDEDKRRFIYDPIAVGMINQLCKEFDCKVVFNSAHNDDGLSPVEGIRLQAYTPVNIQGVLNGIKPEYIHSEPKTGFPVKTDNRLHAIRTWLDYYGDDVDDWIVIDDMLVHAPKQILVQFSLGITFENFIRAKDLLK